jgi:hypothetical protein
MADSSNKFSLKLSGNGLSIDREIPEPLAQEIAVFVLSGGKSELNPCQQQAGQFGAPPAQPGALPHSTSPQEFLRQTPDNVSQ